jgi:hypothetical protein
MTNFIEKYQLSDLTICDSLLQLFWDAHDKKLTYPGKSGPGATTQPEVKKSTDFWLQDADKLGSPEKYRWDKYHNELSNFIDNYLEKYKFLEFGGTFISRHLPLIQWYKPGEGYYQWHIDGAQMSACDRAMVFMTYLNDVEDGGGTMFYHQNYTVKPKKGKTVIFPAGYTHLHKGEISQTEDKFILTGWIWWK